MGTKLPKQSQLIIRPGFSEISIWFEPNEKRVTQVPVDNIEQGNSCFKYAETKAKLES